MRAPNIANLKHNRRHTETYSTTRASTTRAKGIIMKNRIIKASTIGITTLLSVAMLAGCGSLESLTGLSLPSSSSSSSSKSSDSASSADDTNSSDTTSDTTGSKNSAFPSDFTKNGVAHIHKIVDGIDYNLEIFPSQATSRTDKWYAKGEKKFSLNFRAYDLGQPLRTAYGNKRQSYLGNVSISSDVTRSSGTDTGVSPYTNIGPGTSLTFDPEAVTYKNYGMRLTSPKGIFELRNQTIGDLASDAVGVTLHFRFYVNTQRAARSTQFDTQIIDINVPIAIAHSSQTTPQEDVPSDAS